MDGIMKMARAKLSGKDSYVDRFAINVRTTLRQVLESIGDSERDQVNLSRVK
jgi:hypothetical protein